MSPTKPSGWTLPSTRLVVARQARDHGALYAHRHQHHSRGHEPVGASQPEAQEGQAARLTRGAHGPSSSGGCGHLPRPWTGLAQSQCRPCEPRPIEGDVGDRELPHGGSRRPCYALRAQSAAKRGRNMGVSTRRDDMIAALHRLGAHSVRRFHGVTRLTANRWQREAVVPLGSVASSF
jgi:hypothetical protein